MKGEVLLHSDQIPTDRDLGQPDQSVDDQKVLHNDGKYAEPSGSDSCMHGEIGL
jgi:hypothetical protein